MYVSVHTQTLKEPPQINPMTIPTKDKWSIEMVTIPSYIMPSEFLSTSLYLPFPCYHVSIWSQNDDIIYSDKGSVELQAIYEPMFARIWFFLFFGGEGANGLEKRRGAMRRWKQFLMCSWEYMLSLPMYIFFTRAFIIYSFLNIYLLIQHLKACALKSMIAALITIGALGHGGAL